MKLQEYNRKRNFRRSPEPQGNAATVPGQAFVVQKHAASRLHYDFRLELDGVLKSWAIPKGPSLDPSVKSLAVHVEDHPLQYATFEGIIPAGEYGGGTVMVWDRGIWEPEGDAKKQYRAGKLTFQLQGEKLTGSWTLVRMGGKAGEDGKNWLLIKRPDKAARKRGNVLTQKPESVLSGRKLEQIAKDADRVWNGKAAEKNRNGSPKRAAKKPSPAKKASATISPTELSKVTGARRAKLPTKFKPQLATLATVVPRGEDWLHEIKFDGYRLLAFIENETVRLMTRNGNDWTKRFPTTVAALQELSIEFALLDGEIVSLDENGLSDFQSLQNSMKRGTDERLVYYLFDVPYLGGYDLKTAPLIERKALLATILSAQADQNNGKLRYSDHIRGRGDDVHAHACRYAMEGVISKRADCKYEQTRAPTWLKIKCLKRQEFVIGGYTKPSGSRVGFGALLLGYYNEGELQYAGRVGTGFNQNSLRQILADLKEQISKSPPFVDPPKGSQARGVTWVKPKLVAEIEFNEWTDDGLLRHPSFQGLRSDKPAKQVVRETLAATSNLAAKATLPEHLSVPKQSKSSNGESTVAGIRISNPDRILYPEQGVTKLDLAQYYESIADWILPHIRNRPLTLVRCPKGRVGHCFYQKHLTESLPETLRGVTIQEQGKRSEYVVVDDLPGLISLVQFGVLELHPWLSQADNLELPDRMIFDLDPAPGVAWNEVIEAARIVRDRLKNDKLKSFFQTSGGKGLHVVVPLKPATAWKEVKAYAKSIAEELSADNPTKCIATTSKAKRKGKIFIDYLRNSRGATAIASFSTRARAGAPVATPLRWEELAKVNSADQYNVSNIRRRLSALRIGPWPEFFQIRQSLP